MTKKDKVMEEFKKLEAEGKTDAFVEYIEKLIEGDVEAAFLITLKTYSMFSSETIAWMTYVISKVSNKISDYYYDHLDDEDDEFVKKTDEVMDLLEKYEDQEEEA